jgi:hypothetical protein
MISSISSFLLFKEIEKKEDHVPGSEEMLFIREESMKQF